MHQKWSQVRNPKFSWGGMPPDPPSRRARSALYSRTGTLLFKILDPPLCSGLMRILYYMLILAISTHYCTTFQKQSHSLWSPQKNFVVDHTDTPRSWMLIQLQILWLCYSGFDLFRKIGYSGANGTPLMLVCSRVTFSTNTAVVWFQIQSWQNSIGGKNGFKLPYHEMYIFSLRKIYSCVALR